MMPHDEPGRFHSRRHDGNVSRKLFEVKEEIRQEVNCEREQGPGLFSAKPQMDEGSVLSDSAMTTCQPWIISTAHLVSDVRLLDWPCCFSQDRAEPTQSHVADDDGSQQEQTQETGSEACSHRPATCTT
ncbi:hypothetical protein GBF38_000760, partial [Nibea albiflora]